MGSDDFDFDFEKLPSFIEQAMATVEPIATVVRLVYEAYFARGFSEEQALRMTMSLQRDLVKTTGEVGTALFKMAQESDD